jgi:hypothetical protein
MTVCAVANPETIFWLRWQQALQGDGDRPSVGGGERSDHPQYQVIVNSFSRTFEGAGRMAAVASILTSSAAAGWRHWLSSRVHCDRLPR